MRLLSIAFLAIVGCATTDDSGAPATTIGCSETAIQVVTPEQILGGIEVLDGHPLLMYCWPSDGRNLCQAITFVIADGVLRSNDLQGMDDGAVTVTWVR